MQLLAIVLVALLAPEETTYELKYRFPKGLVYVDTQEREVAVDTIADEHTFKWKIRFDSKMRRSILAADHNERPTIERVEVIKLGNTTLEHPEKPAGTKTMASQGKTFVWRRLKERWALFGIDDTDVTERYPILVGRLKNWRDRRLPKGRVKIGDSWEVDALDFLQTSGQEVVPGVKGAAAFTLVEVERGIAEISFDAVFEYRVEGSYQALKAKGTWMFDIEKGRDLSFEMKADLKIDQGKRGTGTIRMKREVSYR